MDRERRDGDDVRARVAETFRLEYARVVASVLRIVRDVDAAEEVVQDAFAQALDRWPADGTPDRPGAWLLTTARRRALDRLRHIKRAGARVDAIAYETALAGRDDGPDVIDPHEIPDDRLRLIFTCCHPALPAESRVALTLKLWAGSRRARSPARSSCPSRPSLNDWSGPSGRSGIAPCPTKCPRAPSWPSGCRPSSR